MGYIAFLLDSLPSLTLREVLDLDPFKIQFLGFANSEKLVSKLALRIDVLAMPISNPCFYIDRLSPESVDKLVS